MGVSIRNIWQIIARSRNQQGDPAGIKTAPPAGGSIPLPIEIAPDDPMIDYFLKTPGVVEVEKLDFSSPALQALKESGVKIAVPLVNQGELVGLLNLGGRLSEQEYSTDDYRLLNNLATQAAPALRVAQLVRQQQAEIQERERLEQELRVAHLIQETLLPKEIPDLSGWEMAAYWQPARAVGGDFYDFISLPDGRLGLVIGDVTDKGVPAALLMSTTRSILRAAAERYSSPGPVLERVNDLLCDDIPRNMFVTCQYIILDPETGRIQFANAGHNLPIRRNAAGVQDLRATGMPLGLFPGMKYDEKEETLSPGESILFYSDGLVEAHNPATEMFGFQHLRELIAFHRSGEALIPFLLDELSSFTGDGWEQEDDVTLLTLRRTEVPMSYSPTVNPSSRATNGEDWKVLDEFKLPSEPGNERLAMEQVAQAIQSLAIAPDLVEKLKTAVAEATMNAMEHGNKYNPELPVTVRVFHSNKALKIIIIDQGKVTPIPEAQDPNLEAKLAGLQSPRGWGLFLIKNMVDEMHVYSDEQHHTMELILNLEGGQDDR